MARKNWDDYTDFELNCRVASYCGLKMPLMLYDNNKPAVNVVGGTKDYCNNPADAWPIITANLIGLTPSLSGDIWEADRHYSHRDENPLRAAMIVFLMMKEADK